MTRRIAMLIAVLIVLAAGAAIYRVETRDSFAHSAAPDLAAAPLPVSPAPSAAAAPKASGHAGKPEGHGAANEAKAAASAAGDPAAEEAPLLRAGEILEYSANVSKLSNVANLRLQVVEKRTFLGKNAWHLQALAHTENPLRMVFELDDQFDSYSDAGNFASLQYEMHLSERGQKVNSVQRMTATGKEPASPDASQTRVLPGTRDPLGMMQYLRTVEWSKTPEVRSTVYDGHKLYDARAAFSGSANVSVAAGKYAASKIAIRVFDNGVEMKDASFALFLANDPSHTPVLLEAVLPWATARVELTRIH